MFELNSSIDEKEEKNVKEIFFKYLKYWYIFLIGAVFCIGATFFYLRYKVIPQYRITSTVLVKDKDEGSSVKTDATLGDLGLIKPSGNIEDQIGILKSSDLMEKVLKELNLNVSYSVSGRINDVELYWRNLPFYIITNGENINYDLKNLTISPKDSLTYELKYEGNIKLKINGIYQFGDKISTPNGYFQVIYNPEYTNLEIDQSPIQVNFKNLNELAGGYSQQLRVESVNETGGLLEISLLDAIPQRGKDIVRTLIEIYAEESVKYQNQLAIGTIEIIDERLKLLTGEITDVEKNIATYKQDNDLTNISSDAAVYLQSAQEANRQLEKYQTQIDILNSIETYLQQNGSARLVPSSLNIEDPTLSSLILQFNTTQQEKKGLLSTTPSDNPLVVNIDRNLLNLKVDILENLRNIKDGLLIAQNNVRNNSYRAQAQIAKVPTAEMALLTINRDQGIKQDLYLYLLQKREEEALSLEAPISNTRIVNSPQVGKFPETPNKPSIYLGSLVLGLFLPFAFIFVKYAFNDKIQTVEEIKKLTNAPLLGQIAHNEDKATLIVSENNSNSISELFRLMRFNLNYLLNNKPNKILLVTSGLQGEGKTFFTANLAVSLALTGKKVVALSFDLRAPKLINALDINESVGITDYLKNPKLNINDITINHSTIENFDIIGSGPIVSNVGELMLNPRIENLLVDLKSKYDYILIDTAPVGKIADAFALAPFIDATIYILRRNYSSKTEIKILNDISKNQKLKNLMVVLNDTKAVSNYGYGKD